MTTVADAASEGVLHGCEILIAVCGGIAAYKTASLVSVLVQGGASVTVTMSRAARRFITPLTFESLTGREVFTSLWKQGDKHDPQHLSLTERADLFIVAPATANILAKMVHGIADDVVSTLALSVRGPVLIAPAMNTRMWEHPAVKVNLALLAQRGVHRVGPTEGWLACRTIGMGRMAEPDDILKAAIGILNKSK